MRTSIPYVTLILAGGLSFVPIANAVVETIDGTVTAEVQEYFGTQVVNSDLAFEDFNDTTSNWPLVVNANLRTLDTNLDEVAGGEATTTLRDPRLSQEPNPKEFGVDAAVFSTASEVRYTSRCMTDEMREITFLAGEVSADAGSELSVRSQFFLDGFMIIWGEAGDESFAQTTARVTLAVDQTRPGDQVARRMLEATLRLEGRPDGNAEVIISGALQQDNIVVTNISGQLPGFGPAFLVIIPEIGIPYDYSAAVDEQFSLVATVEGNVANHAGTGAGVALGVPLTEFSKLVENVTSKVADSGMVDTLKTAVAKAPPALKPLPRSSNLEIFTISQPGDLKIGDFLPICGPVGLEVLGLLGLLPLMRLGRGAKGAGIRRPQGDRYGGNGCSEAPGH